MNDELLRLAERDGERFWNKPLFKWRAIVTVFIGSFFLGSMQVLGFHVPREPQGTIILVGVALLWCICDATDALLSALRSRAHPLKGD